ncbi:MAG: hypothetical protein L6R42_010640, partial [Xanthoria sp. 1 TBL-2021]
SLTDLMPTLRTLGVNNWPNALGDHSRTADYEQNYSNFKFAPYEQNLAVFATEIVQLRKASHEQKADLTVISFGLRERLTNDSNWGYGFSPTYFVKSRAHVMGGEQITKMEPVSGRSCWDVGHEREDYDIDMWAHHIEQFEHGVDVYV